MVFSFTKGQPYNQGQFYDFDEDDFISGCEEAIKKVQASPNNDAGEKLKISLRTQKWNSILETCKCLFINSYILKQKRSLRLCKA